MPPQKLTVSITASLHDILRDLLDRDGAEPAARVHEMLRAWIEAPPAYLPPGMGSSLRVTLGLLQQRGFHDLGNKRIRLSEVQTASKAYAIPNGSSEPAGPNDLVLPIGPTLARQLPLAAGFTEIIMLQTTPVEKMPFRDLESMVRWMAEDMVIRKQAEFERQDSAEETSRLYPPPKKAKHPARVPQKIEVQPPPAGRVVDGGSG